MSGHISQVRVCSTCDDPVHVELCPGALPAITQCQNPTVATIINQVQSTLGGPGYSFVIEDSGPEPLILYTFPNNGVADTFEQMIDLGKSIASDANRVGRTTWQNGPLQPFPSAWNIAGVQYERVTQTTCRIRWRLLDQPESWASSFTPGGQANNWLASITALGDEGMVVTYAVATFAVQIAQPEPSTPLDTLPVSIPCGVEITNGEEIAAAVAARSAVNRSVVHDVACAAGISVLREQVYIDGALVSVQWFTSNGTAIPSPAAFTWGSCGGGGSTDTEIVERLVCAAGVTLVQRTTYTNGVAGAPTYFGVNGATVAAPVAFTEGPCDDQDVQISVEYVCAAGVTLIRRRVIDGETGTLISEAFVGANGATVASPATYSEGHCTGFGAYTALRCGPTSNTTSTAAVTAQRITLENDVVLTAACPTGSTLASTRTPFGANVPVAIAATAVPTNAKSVVVYNATRAAISFTITGGSPGVHQIPPGVPHEITLPDSSPAWSGNWSVANVQGDSGPIVNGVNPSVSVNWVTKS